MASQELSDRMAMVTVPMGRRNIWLTGYRKATWADNSGEQEERSEASTLPPLGKQPSNLDEMLAKVTFHLSHEDRGIASFFGVPPKLSDCELLQGLFAATAAEERKGWRR
jgi:hypothetical protein